jgi:hypothetical protein
MSLSQNHGGSKCRLSEKKSAKETRIKAQVGKRRIPAKVGRRRFRQKLEEGDSGKRGISAKAREKKYENR